MRGWGWGWTAQSGAVSCTARLQSAVLKTWWAGGERWRRATGGRPPPGRCTPARHPPHITTLLRTEGQGQGRQGAGKGASSPHALQAASRSAPMCCSRDRASANRALASAVHRDGSMCRSQLARLPLPALQQLRPEGRKACSSPLGWAAHHVACSRLAAARQPACSGGGPERGTQAAAATAVMRQGSGGPVDGRAGSGASIPLTHPPPRPAEMGGWAAAACIQLSIPLTNRLALPADALSPR